MFRFNTLYRACLLSLLFTATESLSFEDISQDSDNNLEHLCMDLWTQADILRAISIPAHHAKLCISQLQDTVGIVHVSIIHKRAVDLEVAQNTVSILEMVQEVVADIFGASTLEEYSVLQFSLSSCVYNIKKNIFMQYCLN